MQKIWWPSLALLLVACGTDDDDPRSLAGNKYQNPTIGITLQFPATWLLKLDQDFNGTKIELAAAGPPVSGFSPNANIIVMEHQGTTDLNQIMNSAKAQLLVQYPDLANFTARIVDQDGKQFGEISYTATISGYPLKLIQDIILNKGKDIIISYGDMAARFDQNADLAAIRASLIIQ